jgi:hypothetical protein
MGGFYMKKWTWTTLVYGVLFFSIFVFFLYPHHQYVVKLIYLSILLLLGIWHYRTGNRRGMLTSIFGAIFIALLLPNIKSMNIIDFVLLFATWGAVSLIYKKMTSEDGQK